MAGSQGSIAIRPASIWARMSRSDSSTLAPYRWARPAHRDNEQVSFHRYVALGDSFTEGVGDPDPSRPNGLRGWADRVAEVLGRDDCHPGRLRLRQPRDPRPQAAPAILDEQLEPALALEPDLVTVYAGANDILRPKVDIDGLVERYDVALGRLAATGARLVVFTAFDPGGSAIYRPLRGRFALYNELVRTSARAHGATVVDFWTMREYRDWRYWDPDRMHLGPAGHQRMAIEVLDTLGVPHDLAPLPLVDRPVAQPGRPAPREPHLDAGDGGALGAPSADRPIVRRRPRPEAPDADSHRLGSRRPSATSRGSCGCSSVGRARPSQGRCREFESRHPLISRRDTQTGCIPSRNDSQFACLDDLDPAAEKFAQAVTSRDPLRWTCVGTWGSDAIREVAVLQRASPPRRPRPLVRWQP